MQPVNHTKITCPIPHTYAINRFWMSWWKIHRHNVRWCVSQLIQLFKSKSRQSDKHVQWNITLKFICFRFSGQYVQKSSIYTDDCTGKGHRSSSLKIHTLSSAWILCCIYIPQENLTSAQEHQLQLCARTLHINSARIMIHHKGAQKPCAAQTKAD